MAVGDSAEKKRQLELSHAPLGPFTTSETLDTFGILMLTLDVVVSGTLVPK